MIKKHLFLAGMLTASALFSTGVWASNTATVKAKVTGTVIDETVTGACFAIFKKPIADVNGQPLPLDCGATPDAKTWTVTFNCDVLDNELAYHKFDIAQKSEIAKQIMIVTLDDATSPCSAKRVESSLLRK